MQVDLKDFEAGARIEALDDRRLNDDEFYEFCMQNPDLRIEREPSGHIIIMPPAGWETSHRNNDLSSQLFQWARSDGRGLAADSSAEYFLPNGAARGPDGSWVLKSRLAKFSKKELKKFLPLCPDFVIELTSPSDRLTQVKKKMREWMDNGAKLGWLIDADRRVAYIYRPGQEPEELRNPAHLDGEGPVSGFRLELSCIWAGL